MYNILYGIEFGIGFTLGVFLFFLAILIMVFVLLSFRNQNEVFTVKLLEKYKERLISNEEFEEAIEVGNIIDSINTGVVPKDLHKKYSIKKRFNYAIKDGKFRFKPKLKIVKKIK